MTKSQALEKGILYICSLYPIYKTLSVQEKINVKHEIACWWNRSYDSNFHKHIQKFSKISKDIADMFFEEYLFAIGL